MTSADDAVRLHILQKLIASGTAPRVRDTAEALGLPDSDVAAAYERLAANRVIVLKPGTPDVLMAAPLSAVPTPHVVRMADGRSHYGNCVWDALGVIAMRGIDGDVETVCADCDSPLRLAVRGGSLEPSDAVVHFAVPAARWWEDIVFT
jgi:DNA-binding transcriptional MocR family regulator